VKALVVFLLVANGFAFAWWNGLLSQWLGDGREPERMQSQVAADKAKLVPIARLTPPIPVSAFVLCVDYPSTPDTKASELEGMIRALVTAKAAVLKLDKEQTTEGGNFLVYLAASTTSKEAQRKLFELKRVGVEDVALISEGDLKSHPAAVSHRYSGFKNGASVSGGYSCGHQGKSERCGVKSTVTRVI
jgi:hypothetical protein